MSTIPYRPAIDGLRAIAVILVLLYHLDIGIFPGGFVGVDVFFVISGYLITSIVLHDCRKGTFSFSEFYKRRIARIFPVFFLVSAAILIAASLLYSRLDFSSAGALAVASALSLTNVKLIFQGSYFTLSPDAQPFLHYWSLSVEEQFYVFLPLFIHGLHKLGVSRYRSMALTFVLALLSVTACILLTYTEPVWAFYLLPTRAWELLAGSLLAMYTNTGSQQQSGNLDNVMAILGLSCILLACLLFDESTAFPGYAATLPVLGTVLVIGRLHGNNSGSAETWLSLPVLVFIGKASYSLYLWHWPIFSFIDYTLYSLAGSTRLLLKVALTAGISFASYLWYERPLRNLLNAGKSWLAYSSFGACVILFVGLGTAIHSTHIDSTRMADVADGGIRINPQVDAPSIVLMGDSNASMYANVIRDIAKAGDMRANILSVYAQSPLPGGELFDLSLEFLKDSRPDIVVYALLWQTKISGDDAVLEEALRQISAHAGHIILLTQPPVLPEGVSRSDFRQRGVVPVFEDPMDSIERNTSNDLLRSMQDEFDNVSVLDLEPFFTAPDSQIRLFDERGNELFRDTTHLSAEGAQLLLEPLTLAIESILR